MENHRDLFFDAVDDDVLAHRKATQASAQILLAAASHVRVASEEIETLANRIDEPVGSLDAAAFFGHLIPDTIEFGFCFRCDTVRHQREGIARRRGGREPAASPRSPVAASIPA